jgi:8-oxo-dGTP pyrophosphatase MutT (NUDIX family)
VKPVPRSLAVTLPPHRELVDTIAARLAERVRGAVAIDGYRPAAVLLLLGERERQSWVTLIVRPTAMRAHSGQIALPGGVRDACDGSFEACALREAEEELAVPSDEVRVLGLLDDVPTPTGFVITPVVGERVGSTPYRPNPDEVSEVFDAPLAAFSDAAGAEDLGEREAWGVRYRLRAYRVGGHRVWGATARVLENLLEVLHPG